MSDDLKLKQRHFAVLEQQRKGVPSCELEGVGAHPRSSHESTRKAVRPGSSTDPGPTRKDHDEAAPQPAVAAKAAETQEQATQNGRSTVAGGAQGRGRRRDVGDRGEEDGGGQAHERGPAPRPVPARPAGERGQAPEEVQEVLALHKKADTGVAESDGEKVDVGGWVGGWVSDGARR